MEPQPLISLHKTSKYMSVRHSVELWRDIQAVSVKLAQIMEATLPGYHGIPPRLIFTVSQQGYVTQTKCHLNRVEIPQASTNSEFTQVWLLSSALYKCSPWDYSKGAAAGTNTVSEKMSPNLASALQTCPGSCSRFTSSNPNTCFPGVTQETDPSAHFSVGDPSPSQSSDLQSRKEEWEFWLLLLFWGADELFFGFVQKRNAMKVHITDLAQCVAMSSALLQLLHITPQCA